MTGSVNKDGMLRGITFIVIPGKNYERAMMDTLILTGISSNVVSQANKEQETADIALNLINKALQGMENENNSHSEIIGDIKYFAAASKFTGLWFGMEPVENK